MIALPIFNAKNASFRVYRPEMFYKKYARSRIEKPKWGGAMRRPRELDFAMSGQYDQVAEGWKTGGFWR